MPSPSSLDPATRRPDFFVDCDHPSIVAFAQGHAAGRDARAAAVALYYTVRDRLRYSPWNVSSDPEDYKASTVLAREPAIGHCIDKATLLAAAARAIGIPSRLHFADVRNHLGTADLEARLGTNLLVYHGYVELHLGGRWVAATPAFNAGLCERLGVAPLEFDGVNDSIFQAYDRQAGAFMEYVTDHGTHASLPLQDMLAAWASHYGPGAALLRRPRSDEPGTR